MDAIIQLALTAGSLGGEFLSEAGKKMLSEQIIITGIVLYSLRGHFKKIESGLQTVAENVSDLGKALTHVETSHAERIGNLEVEVKEIKKTIGKGE